MNKYKPHVYLIPEDDATRQITVGFVNHHAVQEARIKVVPEVGGWRNVLKTFEEEYVQVLREYQTANVVMIIDFDGYFHARRVEFDDAIPQDVKPRVFVIGPRDTPEKLKNALRISFEKIRISLADDCSAGTVTLWGHELLGHNDTDRQRLVQTVKPFLF